MRDVGRALRMLFAPREAAAGAAEAPLWFPLGALAFAAAFSEYPTLIRYGWKSLAQMRLDLTPDGMNATSIMILVALIWLAPVLLPLCAWSVGRLMDLWIHYAMNMDVDRAQVVRVTLYGSLPFAIERFIIGALRLGCGADCNPFNPLAANLAFFLDPRTTSVFAYEFARAADVFACWAALVVCTALGALTEVKPSRHLFPLAFTWIGACAVRAWLLG